MKTLATVRAGLATHTGYQRSANEDRVLADAANGIFMVVDGLGGHAAGELAAQTALDVVRQELNSSLLDLSRQIPRAIAEANNRIFAMAQEDPERKGMACVLTLAVLREDRLSWGHVGDTRLYLFRKGRLRKLTADHSPVGELEDEGQLSEREAMMHPRRNEVFGDVGSVWRRFDDPSFVESGSLAFAPDAALLLCSDGLTDALTSSEIAAQLERFDGDPDNTALKLVRAANESSGRDNVSVVFVAGPEFAGNSGGSALQVDPRHVITRVRPSPRRRLAPGRSFLWLCIGILLGLLLAAAWERRANVVSGVSQLWVGLFTSPARK